VDGVTAAAIGLGDRMAGFNDVSLRGFVPKKILAPRTIAALSLPLPEEWLSGKKINSSKLMPSKIVEFIDKEVTT